ncbi:MAG: TraR/DksA C4-type zinc finger protein [Opitutaceae bacterium]|nr:TraR/DksA C4-type zinc finger protein [Opitutaceae bacterium]
MLPSPFSLRPSRRRSRLHVARRWAPHYRRLVALRDRLVAVERVTREQASAPLPPGGNHPAERAADEEERDFTLALLAQEAGALDEVNAAIERILHGSYGRCEATGRPIPAARLRAVPWTRYVREIASHLESPGRRGG